MQNDVQQQLMDLISRYRLRCLWFLAEDFVSRYSQVELDELAFAGTPPDARILGAKWHRILQEAVVICDLLPPADVGQCVITTEGALYRRSVDDLRADLETQSLVFRAGTIGGVLPQIKRPLNGW